MEKDSALYQLMDTRMHSVMNGIVSSDGEYQAILRKSDIYSGELDRMDLSKEIRLLIDRYVSEQNALGSRFGMLAYLFLPLRLRKVRNALIMGRIDPVECIGVSQQRNGNVLNVKPPAMRVRDDCYTKITFPL